MSTEAQFAPSLQYSNTKIISGFPLRVKFNPQGQLPTAFTTTGSTISFDMAGTYVDQYLRNTSMDITHSIPGVPDDVAAGGKDTNGVPQPTGASYINCLLKQIPIRNINITSKTGVVLCNLTNIIYMAPLQFYGKHVLMNTPHTTYGNYERVIMNRNTTPLVVNQTYNLGDSIKTFFNIQTLTPLTEIVTVTVELCTVNEISYQIKCVGVDGNTNMTANAIRDRLFYKRYKQDTFTTGTDQAALTSIILNSDKPANTVAGLTEVYSVGTQDIPISKLEFYGSYESSEQVKLILRGLLNKAQSNGTKMQVPFSNMLSQKYTLQGTDGVYTLSHRVTSNVGRYLKHLYFTFARSTDNESLIKNGSYNLSYFGSWRLATVDITRDGKNVWKYDVSRNAHENLPYGFTSPLPSDNILENQYFADQGNNLSSNNGRFRALQKDNFFGRVDFEEISDPRNKDVSSSIVSGIPIHGDVVFNFDITFVKINPADPANSPANIQFIIFQEGVRYLAIDNASVGLAVSELTPIMSRQNII